MWIVPYLSDRRSEDQEIDDDHESNHPITLSILHHEDHQEGE